MDDSKTVRSDDISVVTLEDPLYSKQKEDVARMRTSLLSCTGDPMSVKTALHNITVMRVYHQITRIIRYTEVMDKLENKLYEAIEHSVENFDASNPSTWIALLGIQEKLQKSMIESHKLLQPYLDLENLTFLDEVGHHIQKDDENTSFANMILDQDSRDKLRTSAQAVLAALTSEQSSITPSVSNDSEGRGDVVE